MGKPRGQDSDAVPGTATAPGQWVLRGACVLVVAACGWYLLPANGSSSTTSPRTTAPVTRPPQPRVEQTADGVSVARLDLAALSAWCAQYGLPAPPPMQDTEPVVAERLVEAYYEAAAQPTAETLGRLGMVCEGLGAHACSEYAFTQAKTTDPTAFRWPYYLGCVYQTIGRRDDALQALREAHRLRPEHAMVNGRLAHLLLEGADLAAARRHADQYARLAAGDSFGQVLLSRLRLAADDNAGAIAHGREAVRLGPQDFQAHHTLALAYRAAGQLADAQHHFDECARLPRGQWFTHRDDLALELKAATASAESLLTELEQAHAARDYARAAKLAEQVIQRRPADVVMMANLAGHYRELGRYAEAQAVLNRAEQLQPDALGIALARAELLFARQESGRAIAACEDILQRDPVAVRAWSVKGRALAREQRYAEALQAMTRCVELDAWDAGNTLVLGELQWAFGHLSQAAATYERVLELLPGQALATRRLQEIAAQQNDP